MEGAIDFLRKKGQKIAAKRGDRDAREGFKLFLNLTMKMVIWYA